MKHQLEGKVFGALTVLGRAPNQKKRSYWTCKCECGIVKDIATDHLVRKTKSTKSCGCNMVKSGQDHIQWEGVGEISAHYWTRVRRNGDPSYKAIRKNRVGMDYDIDITYGWGLFLEQDKKCALSKLPLSFGRSTKGNKNLKEVTASLDRIDSTKGYIKGNVQWVHKDINLMKNVYTQEYFINLCKMIAENN